MGIVLFHLQFYRLGMGMLFCFCAETPLGKPRIYVPVSYTHLDVYKRQPVPRAVSVSASSPGGTAPSGNETNAGASLGGKDSGPNAVSNTTGSAEAPLSPCPPCGGTVRYLSLIHI